MAGPRAAPPRLRHVPCGGRLRTADWGWLWRCDRCGHELSTGELADQGRDVARPDPDACYCPLVPCVRGQGCRRRRGSLLEDEPEPAGEMHRRATTASEIYREAVGAVPRPLAFAASIFLAPLSCALGVLLFCEIPALPVEYVIPVMSLSMAFAVLVTVPPPLAWRAARRRLSADDDELPLPPARALRAPPLWRCEVCGDRARHTVRLRCPECRALACSRCRWNGRCSHCAISLS